MIKKLINKNVFLGQLDRLGQFADVRSSLAKNRVALFFEGFDTLIRAMLQALFDFLPYLLVCGCFNSLKASIHIHVYVYINMYIYIYILYNIEHILYIYIIYIKYIL